MPMELTGILCAWRATIVHPQAGMVASSGASSGTHLDFTIASQQDLNIAWNTIAEHSLAMPNQFTFSPRINNETRDVLTTQIRECSSFETLLPPLDFEGSGLGYLLTALWILILGLFW